MTEDEMIERLWEASRSGATLRAEWLEEFVRSPDAKEALRALFAEADAPTQSALVDLLHEYADAPRRNASKSRQKKEHWRVLADHLNQHGSATRNEKFYDIPQDNHQDPLTLCGGQFEFSRRWSGTKPEDRRRLIRCSFDDGTAPEEISFETFVKYLKVSNGKKSGAVSG